MGEAQRSSVPDPALAAHFTRLLDAYQASLVAFALGLVGERELARDVVQETFVAAWRAAVRQEAPFRDPCDVDDQRSAVPPSRFAERTPRVIPRGAEEGARRWLYAVTYRQAALALRRQRRFVWQSLDHDGADEAGEATVATPDIALHVAEADALRSALNTLNPEDAACFLLQVVHGFSTQEIAAVVHVRPGAVRKRLSRARQRLRAAIAAQLANASNTTEGRPRR
ncbi:MAG TPA: RNA polymerase sigma factor [Ktedonobacterales bacterium]|nr:RNA polymerase sigma factor [Ktedonobacterales bacterium]